MFIIETASETALVGLLSYLLMVFADAGQINVAVLIVLMVWAMAIFILINIPGKKNVDKRRRFQ